MKVITYLGFTVLSIFIQFCVMDFIQEKVQIGEDVNISSQKDTLSDLLKNISSKPHALYYRTHITRSLKTSSPSKIYTNTSITEVPLGTTDATTTIFDVLYDENTSEIDSTSTTENYFTSTELDNITDINLFEIKNKSSNEPNNKPKIKFSKHCDCNLLYLICDINCCCDQDCSESELRLFYCDVNGRTETRNNQNLDGCITHLLDEQRYGSTMLDNLLCVVKTNLPSKKNVKKYDPAHMGPYYKWKSVDQKHTTYQFKKTLYKWADPIWLIKNGSIYYLDFPAPMVNNYCTDRVQIAFLKEESTKCYVKFEDLEMFTILKTAEESMVISATEQTFNSSDLNCTNLHCVNWTILTCDDGICLNSSKSSKEPSCTDTFCANIALNIDYDFYYYDKKIINATIKLHIQNISFLIPYLLQEVNVNFYMANKSIEKMIEFSGSPGYIRGLPIIVSYMKSNYTKNFFNKSAVRRTLLFPENKNGLCVLLNTSNNIVRFGINKRTKCRYIYTQRDVVHDKNKVCNIIQTDINEMLRLNYRTIVSPLGNPYGISDDNWLNLDVNSDPQEPVYGEYNENTSKLHCYNIINTVTFVFMYAIVDENGNTGQNKIISAKCELAKSNFSFLVEDISTVITIDINFVDITKPSHIEYAGGPQLNIHLPKDFFFPFPSNNCYKTSKTCILTMICCCVILFSNKITLE